MRLPMFRRLLARLRITRRPRIRRRLALRLCHGVLISLATAVARSGFDQLLGTMPWA